MSAGSIAVPQLRLGPVGLLLALTVATAAAATTENGLFYGTIMIFGLTVTALVLTRPVFGIVLMIVSFLFVYSKWIPMVRPFTPNVTLGALLSLALLLRLYRERDFWFLRSTPVLIVAAIAIAYSLSTAAGKADLPRLSAGYAMWDEQTDLEKLLTRWAFLLFFVCFVDTRKRLTLVVAVLFAMVYAAVPASFMMVMSGAGWGGYRARAGWLLHSAGNPNRLAFLCLFAAAILWCYLADRRGRGGAWTKLFGVPGLVSLFVAAIATGSRSGFLNTLIVAALLGARGRGARLRRLALGGLVLACSVVVISELLPEKAVYRATAPLADPASDVGQRSAEKRGHTASVGFEIFRRHPWLGVGMGNFAIHQQAIDPKEIASAAHNSYVLALTEGGLLVFCLYCWLFAWCLRSLARVERAYLVGRAPPIDLLWLVRALRVNWVLLLSFSLFADVWIHIIFYVMVGLVVVLRRLHGERERLFVHALEVRR
jgi:hypothetical protein